MPISQDQQRVDRGEVEVLRKPSVGVVMRESADRSEAGGQLAFVAVLRYLGSIDALGDLVASGSHPIDVVVTDASTLRAGMAAWRGGVLSRMPVVVYDRADQLTADALPVLLVPGMRVEFVVRPSEPLPPAVRRVMAAGWPTSAVPLILRRLLPLAPPPIRVFLAIAVLKATSGRGVEQLARWSRISPRTAERRLARARWATARVVLQTLRALDAVWLMSEHGWPARRIQRVRQFSHASAITRLMQRYLGGLTPAGVREGAGFEAALDFACAALAHPRSTPSMSRRSNIVA